MKGSPRDVRRRVRCLLSILPLSMAAACAQPAGDTAPAADTTAAAQQPTAAYTADDVVLASAKIGLPPTTITPADLPETSSSGATSP